MALTVISNWNGRLNGEKFHLIATWVAHNYHEPPLPASNAVYNVTWSPELFTKLLYKLSNELKNKIENITIGSLKRASNFVVLEKWVEFCGVQMTKGD